MEYKIYSTKEMELRKKNSLKQETLNPMELYEDSASKSSGSNNNRLKFRTKTKSKQTRYSVPWTRSSTRKGPYAAES